MLGEGNRRRGWTWGRRTHLLLGIVTAGFLFLGGMGLIVLRPNPPTLPVPNGYDDLVRAGKRIVGPSGVVDPSLPANREALALARVGLGRVCQVPVAYSQDQISRASERLSLLRQLARAFEAEGKQAEAAGRLDEAIDSYLDTVRLGQATARGGLMMDDMTGVAIESNGLEHLAGLRDRLSADQARRVVTALGAIDRDRPPFAAVLEQERAWSRGALGWRRPLLLLSPAARRQLQASDQMGGTSHRLGRARLRQVMTELFLHADRLGPNSSVPEGLDPIVPAERPPDPAGGLP